MLPYNYMQDRITKGIKAEHFALKILLENGFKIADINNKTYDDLRYIDFVMEKNNKIYRIQVKSWIDAKRPVCKLTNVVRDEMNYISHVFDFIFFTNLKDYWILPYEFIKRKHTTIYLPLKKIKCFKNNLKIVEMDENGLKIFLLDNGLINE